MPLRLTDDLDTVAALLDERLAADPVRATYLGAIRAALLRPVVDPWCAVSGQGGLAVRSAAGRVVQVYGAWVAGDLRSLATTLAGLPGLIAIAGPTPPIRALATLLPRPAVRTMTQRLYRLEHLRPPSPPPGHSELAGPADRTLVSGWFRAFAAEAGVAIPSVPELVGRIVPAGQCWLWHLPASGGVAMAGRQPVVAGSGPVGPVYTPPEHRRRGYGAAVTAAATRAVLDDVGIPVLTTDLANATSNELYTRLGYQSVEDRLEVFYGGVPGGGGRR